MVFRWHVYPGHPAISNEFNGFVFLFAQYVDSSILSGSI